MKTSSPKPGLVVILGPTAVGKTNIAIQLAGRLNGEIVSADSRLFYRGMNIGTAKPSPEELGRIPHHLIDVADPSDTWSLSTFQHAAARSIASIHAKHKLPFLVGGTGQYISAVIQGWSPPAAAPDLGLRQALENLAEQKGKEWLHAQLAHLDPAAYASIDARNLRRTIRALEVIFTTGRRFSDQQRKIGNSYNVLQIGLTLPRAELYARIDERIETMFATGLLEEAKNLLKAGYAPSLPSLSAIGYRESILVIEGKMTLDEAKNHMRKATRMFVRRQANWFKTIDELIHWVSVSPGSVDVIEHTIRQYFGSSGGSAHV